MSYLRSGGLPKIFTSVWLPSAQANSIRLDAVPNLQRDFLEEILAIRMRGAIDARHLE